MVIKIMDVRPQDILVENTRYNEITIRSMRHMPFEIKRTTIDSDNNTIEIETSLSEQQEWGTGL